MIEWAEYEHEMLESEEKNPESVVCEVSAENRTAHVIIIALLVVLVVR